jgi:hypothetical protein
MTATASKASGLALLAVVISLILGGTSLWWGVAEGAIAFWGFGAACLLQVPPALSLRGRIREGLGNAGLERERLTLRTISHLLRFLALGMAMASVSAWLGDRAPQVSPIALGLAALALGLLAPTWYAKRGLTGIHPTLDLDATRTRTQLELAALLLLGSLMGHWFPRADAATGLAMALRLFLEGRTLAKGTTLQAATCGGGCGGCG